MLQIASIKIYSQTSDLFYNHIPYNVWLDQKISLQSGEKVSSGRFTLEESCSLLELVMNQQKRKNFDSIDIKKINFKAIGEAMNRSSYYLEIHFSY